MQAYSIRSEVELNESDFVYSMKIDMIIVRSLGVKFTGKDDLFRPKERKNAIFWRGAQDRTKYHFDCLCWSLDHNPLNQLSVLVSEWFQLSTVTDSLAGFQVVPRLDERRDDISRCPAHKEE